MRLIVQIRDTNNIVVDQFAVETEEGTEEQFAAAIHAVVETNWSTDDLTEDDEDDEDQEPEDA